MLKNSKKFLFFSLIILGVFVFPVLSNNGIAEAQFDPPLGCEDGWGGTANSYSCPGTPPPESPECKSISRQSESSGEWSTGNCVTACLNVAKGVSLKYTIDDHPDYYCCDGSGGAICKIYGEDVIVGNGEVTSVDFSCTGCGVTNLGACFVCLLERLASIFFGIALFLPALLMFILAALGAALYSIATILAMWIAKVSLTIPITPSNLGMGRDFIVAQAWRFTRDFADMFLLLILAFIGLSTILKLKDYETKKLLPTLIIVALLINFSPVLIGVIVDIGNIVGNFFLSKTGVANIDNIWVQAWDYFLSIFKVYSQSIPQTISGDPIVAFAPIMGTVVQGFVLAAFYTLGAVAYSYVGVLFFLRTVFLWLLTISAPIVFLFYILPQTKKYFSTWLSELISWAILGIPIGFFLMISNWIMQSTNQQTINQLFDPSQITTKLNEAAQNPQAIGIGGVASIFVNLLAPTLGLIILFVGTKVSRSMAPKAAQQIISSVEKGVKTVAMLAATYGLNPATSAISRKALPEIEKFGKNLAASGMETEKSKGGVFPAIARFGKRWVGRSLAVGAGKGIMALEKYDSTKFDNGKKEATNKNSEDNFRKMNAELLKGPLVNWDRVAGLLVGTIENKDSDDIEKSLKEGILAPHASKIKEIIEAGKRMGSPGYRPIVKALFGHIITNPEKFGYNATYDKKTGKLKDDGDAEDIKILNSFIDKTPEKLKSQEIEGYYMAPSNFNPDTDEGKFAIRTLIKERGADFMPQLARRANKAERDKILQFIFKEGEYENTGMGIDEIGDDVLRYLTSPGARSAGVGKEYTQGQVNKMIEERSYAATEELKNKLVSLREQLETIKKQQKGQGGGKGMAQIKSSIDITEAKIKLATENSIDSLRQMISDRENTINQINGKPVKSDSDREELQRLTSQKRQYQNAIKIKEEDERLADLKKKQTSP
ncbi:MAG: type IV secretion system protein [Candidatus Pacebacteria bacterium]|nr:type IV secretion system protein [Candidatus Paceibacterota bacterium]